MRVNAALAGALLLLSSRIVHLHAKRLLHNPESRGFSLVEAKWPLAAETDQISAQSFNSTSLLHEDFSAQAASANVAQSTSNAREPEDPQVTQVPITQVSSRSSETICKPGDLVMCADEVTQCAGNQCCPGGDACPSADSNYSLCPQPKAQDCTSLASADCGPGHYCTSGVLDETCGLPYQCLPCNATPNGSESGLRCTSCALDFESQNPVCLNGVGCQSGKAAQLYDPVGTSDDYKKRLFCRPLAFQADQVPGLCAGNLQGGLTTASAGEIWRMRKGEEWVDTLVRFQPYVTKKGVVIDVYLAAFAETDNRRKESSYKWAGSLMRAEHAVAFPLQKEDKIALSTKEPCDHCIWRIRDAHSSDEEGIEVELEFKRNVTHPITFEKIDDPPILRLSKHQVYALAACLDLLRYQKLPSKDGPLEAALVMQRAQEIISMKRGDQAVEDATGGKWTAPKTTLPAYVRVLFDKNASEHILRRLSYTKACRLPDGAKETRWFEKSKVDTATSTSRKRDWTTPMSFGGPVKCVPFSTAERGAALMKIAIQRSWLGFLDWPFYSWSGAGFLEELAVGENSIMRYYTKELLISITKPLPVTTIDNAMKYNRKLLDAAATVFKSLRHFRKTLKAIADELRSAEKDQDKSLVTVDAVFSKYCEIRPHGVFGGTETESRYVGRSIAERIRVNCKRYSEQFYAVYLASYNRLAFAQVSGTSVCGNQQRVHKLGARSCLPSKGREPQCIEGEALWCMHGYQAALRCCCAEAAIQVTNSFLNIYKIRKASDGCLAYRFAV